MKMGQSADYYRARIESVEDYILMDDKPDWRTMCAILGLPIPYKKVLEIPEFMEERK